jgi:hypothetical protein
MSFFDSECPPFGRNEFLNDKHFSGEAYLVIRMLHWEGFFRDASILRVFPSLHRQVNKQINIIETMNEKEGENE